MKYRRWTLDADAYYIHFQNGYDSYTDPVTTESIFVATGPTNTKGIEAESDFVLGRGFSVYLNGTGFGEIPDRHQHSQRRPLGSQHAQERRDR